MFGQTFQIADLGAVAALVVLEALLSADNALVLAMMVRHLPKDEQKKALLFGLGGAFVFRLVAILFASFVLKQWWLQGIGAAYLLYLPFKHFRSSTSAKDAKPVGAGFWKTVIVVELTDIAFAVDSVLAGVTFVDNRTSKLWVVYFGALIGIVLLRFAAALLIRLLDRYPFFDHVAYALVAWVGVKLGFLAVHAYDPALHEMPPTVFWSVLLVIAAGGTGIAVSNARRNGPPDAPEEPAP